MQGDSRLQVLITARDELSARLQAARGEVNFFRQALEQDAVTAQRFGVAVTQATEQLQTQLSALNSQVAAMENRLRIMTSTITRVQAETEATNASTAALERNIGARERAMRALLASESIADMRAREAALAMRGEDAARALVGLPVRSRSRQEAERDFIAAESAGVIRSRTTGRFVGETDISAEERNARRIQELTAEETAIRAQADAMRTAFYEREMREVAQLEAARRRAMQTEKENFDRETAMMERQAQAIRARSAATISDMRVYNLEQDRADRQRRQFAEQIAPRTRVRFTVGDEGELKVVEAGIANIGHAANRSSPMVRHLVAAFDELKRGQLGAFFSTLGASMRDAGLGSIALGAGITALAAIGVAEGIQRMTTRFGELALKERTAAASVGMGIEEYSRLRAVFQLVSGDANRLDQVIGMLGEHAEQALENPMSRAASAFANLHISMQQVASGMERPQELLEILRQRWQEMGESMQRTEVFRALLGRGFEALVPLLNMTSAELSLLNSMVTQNGDYMDSKLNAKLVEAGIKAHGLSEAFSGLGQQLAELSSGSGFTDWMTRQVEGLKDFTKWLGEAASAARNIPPRAPPVDWLSQKFLDTLRAEGQAGGFGSIGRYLSAPTPAPDTMRAGGGLDLVGRAAKSTADVVDLQSTFASRLEAWMQSLPEAEQATIRISSGFRSAATQAELFARSDQTGRMVARPGSSAHGFGIAADIRGMSEAAAATLPEFGLHRPMPWEPWHVEPSETLSATSATAAARRRSFENFIATQGGTGEPTLTGVGGVFSGAATTMAQPSTPFVRFDADVQMQEMNRQIKQIEDIRKIKESEAEHDKAAQLRAAQEALDAEAKLRQEYAGRARAAGQPEEVQRQFLDTTNARVRSNQLATQADDEAYRRFKESQLEKIADVRNAETEITSRIGVSAQEKVAAEQNASTKINALYAELRDKSTAMYHQGAEEWSRVERERVNATTTAERQISAAKRQGLEDDFRRAQSLSSTMRTTNADIFRGFEAEQAARVSRREILPQEATRAAITEVQRLAAAQKEVLDHEMEIANATGNLTDKTRVWLEEWKLGVETHMKVLDLEKQLEAQNRKTVEAVAKPFQQAFDQIGSGLEKAITDALLRRGTSTNIMRDLYQQAVAGLVHMGGSLLSQVGAGLLGGKPGEGLGATLATQLAQLILHSSLLGGILASTSATAAATTASAATTGVSAIGSAGSFLGGIGSFFKWIGGLSLFGEGGVVPAGAAGMMVGSGGFRLPRSFGSDTMLGALTPGEMVLPTNISAGLQRMLGSGEGGFGGDVHVHVAPGGMIMDGPSFQQWFIGPAGGRRMMIDAVRDAFRSNAITPRTF